MYEEPFGYKDAHYGYLLTTCPGLYKIKVDKKWKKVVKNNK